MHYPILLKFVTIVQYIPHEYWVQWSCMKVIGSRSRSQKQKM